MRIFNFGTQLFQRESISIGFEFSQRHPYRYITIRIRIRFKKRVTRFTYFTCNRPIFQKKEEKKERKRPSIIRSETRATARKERSMRIRDNGLEKGIHNGRSTLSRGIDGPACARRPRPPTNTPELFKKPTIRYLDRREREGSFEIFLPPLSALLEGLPFEWPPPPRPATRKQRRTRRLLSAFFPFFSPSLSFFSFFSFNYRLLPYFYTLRLLPNRILH